MFDHYRSRMAYRGANMSEMLRMQSNMVVEQTWDRDPNYRRVYVVRVDRGLPMVTDQHELVDVKFNVDTYQKVGSDEPAYHIQFRHGAEKYNSDITVGSYVCMEDEDGEWKWWMITGLDERPQFRQYTINECNWRFGWVIDSKIYYHLGVLRNGSTTREADENSYTSIVNGNCIVWMATNAETQLIRPGQRFLISDVGRVPPLCYTVSTITDTMPLGITRFVMTQSTFDPEHDNVELMLADYYGNTVEPTEPKPESDMEFDVDGTATINYSGTTATVKVGGSYKTFTPMFGDEGVSVDKWLVTDESGNDIFEDTANYTIVYDGDKLKLKVSANYYLIDKVLTIKVVGTDGSAAEVSVKVV